MEDIYRFIRNFIYQTVGIVLTVGKDYIIEHRLSETASEAGFSSLADFMKAAEERTEEYSQLLIDALTVTETFFFRDAKCFDIIHNFIIPEIMKKNAVEKRVRIWSAVCASGQEPYSLKMLIDELYQEHKDWRFQIYCTDVNSKMLEKAKKGEYSELEISRGLPGKYKTRYFREYEDRYTIHKEVLDDMHFSKVNLLEQHYNVPSMDIILLRNVLIYFDEKTRSETVRKIQHRLKSGGFLLLGSTEYLKNADEYFTQIRIDNMIVYQKI